MRKTLFLFFTINFCFGQQVNIPEPEFVGNVIYVDNNHPLELEKQKVSTRTSASAGLVLVGIGSVSSSLIIKGDKSPVKIKADADLKFVIRVLDNNFDPFENVELLKLKTEGKERKLKVASVGTFESPNSGDFFRVKFKAEKYGKSSYLVTVPAISKGEYAFNVSVVSSENVSKSTSTFYLFGIEYDFKVGEIVEWIEEKFELFSSENSSRIKVGKIIEINDGKPSLFSGESLTVITKTGRTEKIYPQNTEIRKLNNSELKNTENIEPLKIGDEVMFLYERETWYGRITDISENIGTIIASDKGTNQIKKVDLKNVERKTKNEEVNLSKYTPLKLYDLINVGDSVTVMESGKQRWIGNYVGTNEKKAFIKTTEKGKVIIKGFNQNNNELIKFADGSISSLFTDSKPIVKSENTQTEISKTSDSQINSEIAENSSLNAEPKIGDIVIWEDDKKLKHRGKLISISDGVANINEELNGVLMSRFVAANRLKKDFSKIVPAPVVINSNENVIKQGDKVTWQDDLNKMWEGRIFNIQSGIASINVIINGKNVTKKVKVEKLTKKY